MRRLSFHTALICICAFLGGVVSEQLLRPSGAWADMLMTTQVFHDNFGRRRIDLDASGDHPVQDFYGSSGTLRLQLGTYPGEERVGSEAGLPLLGLSDISGRLRMLLRIAQGKNQSPILVMKDSKGKDRVLLGISMNGEDEEPFMVYFDKNGLKHTVFGSF